MSKQAKAKAKKTEIKLTEIQSAIVRKYSALSSKASDAYNSLTGYSQEFMTSAVLFDGSWSDEAIEDLNKSLKAMQSRIERKSAGYSTFSSAKAVILKAFRLGIADVRKPKSELEAECKAKAKKAEESNGTGEESDTEESAKPELTPAMLIQQALELLIKSGDKTPAKTAQALLIQASQNVKKA